MHRMNKIRRIDSDNALHERFGENCFRDPKIATRLAFMALGGHVDMDYLGGRTWGGDATEHSFARELYYVMDLERGGTTTRYELAKRVGREVEYAATRRRIDDELDELLAGIDTKNNDEQRHAVQEFLERNGFVHTSFLVGSPLFPEGRAMKVELTRQTLTSSHLVYGATITTGNHYQLSDHARERFFEIFIGSHDARGDLADNNVDEEGVRYQTPTYPELTREKLHQRFGAKSANLLHANRTMADVTSIGVTIPPFLPVETVLYDAWLQADGKFELYLDEVYRQAVELMDTYYWHKGLVIIRSSAVNSEDGEHTTGAGIYDSCAVNIHDRAAFNEAVLQIFNSVNSERACMYRVERGIMDERMGLLVQPYIESQSDLDSLYGYAESSAKNDCLVVFHTQLGPVAYNKRRVMDSPEAALSMESTKQWMHTQPDHDTELGRRVFTLYDMPKAVTHLETIFGGPVQVEFVHNFIVQVRPISVPQETKFEFPDQKSTLTLSSNTVGDMTLERLDPYGNNTGKRGFVIVEQEYAFTDYWNNPGAELAIPESGAVIICVPHTNGHIQTLCREKGVLCFYPEIGDHTKVWEINEAMDSVQTARFVCDGFEGRIYAVESAQS
jgi:hypothetical protein